MYHYNNTIIAVRTIDPFIGVAKSMVFWPEMYLVLSLVFQAVIISDFHLYYCEGILLVHSCVCQKLWTL